MGSNGWHSSCKKEEGNGEVKKGGGWREGSRNGRYGVSVRVISSFISYGNIRIKGTGYLLSVLPCLCLSSR